MELSWLLHLAMSSLYTVQVVAKCASYFAAFRRISGGTVPEFGLCARWHRQSEGDRQSKCFV